MKQNADAALVTTLLKGRPHYKLEGRELVPVDDFVEWAVWFETFPPIAATLFDGCRVSTIFLGIDHNFAAIIRGDDDAPPLLFETMVFGGPLHREQTRCSTYDEAEAQHALMVERVKREAGPS